MREREHWPGDHRGERPHADRYAELPEETRELLEDPERVERLIRAADFMRWAETTSRYVKWTVLFVLAVFVTVFSLADYVGRALAWLRGG